MVGRDKTAANYASCQLAKGEEISGWDRFGADSCVSLLAPDCDFLNRVSGHRTESHKGPWVEIVVVGQKDLQDRSS